MLLRRPLSALLRPLLASSASASPSPAYPLRLSGAAAATAALRRRPGLVLPRLEPFCTSGNIAPMSNALACLDPLEVLRLRLEKERGICINRLVPGVQHSGGYVLDKNPRAELEKLRKLTPLFYRISRSTPRSEEDLALKQQLDLYVERVQDSDPGVQKLVLESMRNEIRTTTSSMTSVPKPLKFMHPHYGTLKEFFDSIHGSENQRSLAGILSVLALTMSIEGERDS